jgi:adenylate cyclase
MGKAIVRAGFLATEAEQLAVWDGGPGPSAVGTGSDVATWRATGRVTHVVDSGGRSAHKRRRPAGATRVVRALLFADVVGYGRLSESQIRVFVETLLGVVVEILARYESEISLRQRWGDALHLVFTSVSAAAECALDLHEAVRALPLAELGLPDDLSFRIGAHAGPVFSGVDPIEGRATFFGEPVTRAARIEPMTPPGQVFVTDEFAALATLEAGSTVACEYVGHVETSKGYGRFPMYVLKRRGRA